MSCAFSFFVSLFYDLFSASVGDQIRFMLNNKCTANADNQKKKKCGEQYERIEKFAKNHKKRHFMWIYRIYVFIIIIAESLLKSSSNEKIDEILKWRNSEWHQTSDLFIQRIHAIKVLGNLFSCVAGFLFAIAIVLRLGLVRAEFCCADVWQDKNSIWEVDDRTIHKKILDILLERHEAIFILVDAIIIAFSLSFIRLDRLISLAYCRLSGT